MGKADVKETGGELFRIVPEESYGEDYEACADRAKNELGNEIEGKTVIPFFSHNGSANSVTRMSELAEGATVLGDEVLSLRGSEVSGSETEVKEWAAGFKE